jgi:hypothetical protein
VRDILPVVDGEASTATDHEKAFASHVSKLSAAAADGSWLAIHGNIVLALFSKQSHSKVYAASAMYAVLDTVPPSLLNLPVS